ncbi:hypothetical protein GCM10009823_25060 [Brevibacterium salitolerans]|uniref:Uncharacterized protein n=1 Tax=Brevibacterium salitolerans TaxID=1403566 RepID=A0ABN2X1L7_9MICO
MRGPEADGTCELVMEASYPWGRGGSALTHRRRGSRKDAQTPAAARACRTEAGLLRGSGTARGRRLICTGAHLRCGSGSS